MTSDPFSTAGKGFRRESIRDNAARDQALSALTDLVDFCIDGVRRFYDAETTDVHVELRPPAQISIQFGYRPGRVHRVLNGPWATLFVTPDGKILWAACTEWGPADTPTPDLEAEALDASDYRGSLTPKLIAFLRDAETRYTSASS